MRIGATSTTDEVLRELGARLRAFRLQQNQTIVELARQAGIGSRTLGRAEAGENPSLETLVRILRALGRLDAVDSFLPEPLASPLQLAAARGRVRRNASVPRTK